ncbi:MAG TPA: hypothetical protein VN764_06445 [Polyangiaceae bacterium]|nr:hypothetical protein [Polyangiaceae bacterium]
MSADNHKLYKDSSPYYQGILARYGRGLGPADVRGILDDHSVSVADYLGDPMVALGELPAETDASDLLAFLGY